MAFVTRQAGHAVAVENVAEGGPSLAFVAFPYALAQLPYSAWFSFVFFFALVTLGIDSAFSITESVLAAVVDKTGWRRSVVLPAVSVFGVVIGIVYVTQGGLNWLGVIGDFIDGTWGIAFLGLLECIVLGWLWRVDVLRRHANERSDWRLGRWWDYLIRIVIPVVLGALFFWSLHDDLSREQGFLRNAEGGWILTNCVGLSVMILVPVAAVVVSCLKGRGDIERRIDPEVGLPVGGRAVGVLALALSIASALLVGRLFRWAVLGQSDIWLLWLSLPPAVIAVFTSNHLVNRYNRSATRPSWLVRWAGALATMDMSGFVALYLIYSTGRQEQIRPVSPIPGQLSAVSYLILCMVLLLIIGGLGWCFYRALSAANRGSGLQHPDEIGDEQQSDS